MLVVYILRSLTAPNRPYVGLTHDLQKRLDAHNSGRYAPFPFPSPPGLGWFRFPSPGTPSPFDPYLKSGSGRAFAKRHFEP